MSWLSKGGGTKSALTDQIKGEIVGIDSPSVLDLRQVSFMPRGCLQALVKVELPEKPWSALCIDSCR